MQLYSGAISGKNDHTIVIESTHFFCFLSLIMRVARHWSCSIWVGTTEFKHTRSVLWNAFHAYVRYRFFSKKSLKKPLSIEFQVEHSANFRAEIYQHKRPLRQRLHRWFSSEPKESLGGRYPQVQIKNKRWFFDVPVPVDVVYTWVNGRDPDWLKMYRQHFPKAPLDKCRYQDKGDLKYSLRALALNMPWVRHVYIVSNCKPPIWLDREHPQIHWISHEEIFPDHSALPTFNSHAIESCIHRIPGLSERFIYFNDDCVITQPKGFHDCFDEQDRSCVNLEHHMQDLEYYAQCEFNVDTAHTIAWYHTTKLLKQRYPAYGNYSTHKHAPQVFSKSLLERIEQDFYTEINAIRYQKKRSKTDILLTCYLYHHYALLYNKAVIRDVTCRLYTTFVKEENSKKVLSYGSVCFNDNEINSESDEFAQAYTKLINCVYPHKSPYEKSAC